MKKIYAIVMMAAALAACNQEELPQIVEEPEAPTYTMIIEATKGEDDNTKALSLSGKALNATWAEGEAVTVYNVTRSADLSGTLIAQSSGTSTVLKGTLTGTIQNGDQLKLKFLSPSYTSQTGTLEYIAANCDYAEATVTVTDASTPSVTTTAANFVNQQAIVKFTLKHKATDATVNVSTLTVSDGTNTYTVTPASATNVLYVAIPGFSGKTVTLYATHSGCFYDYEKSGVTFANGQYYEITVKMIQRITYTAPTLRTGLTFNGNQSNPSGSAQNLVNAGSVTYGTICYSIDGGSNWSTSVPTRTNAGTYTVHYKVVPYTGYSGGVGSTSLGSTTIAKANGWVRLSSYSSTGWNTAKRKEVTITATHHGGTLTGSSPTAFLSVSVSGNNVTITKLRLVSADPPRNITITSAATANYKAASATYTCNQ